MKINHYLITLSLLFQLSTIAKAMDDHREALPGIPADVFIGEIVPYFGEESGHYCPLAIASPDFNSSLIRKKIIQKSQIEQWFASLKEKEQTDPDFLNKILIMELKKPVSQNNFTKVQFLLNQGASISCEDISGKRPIHFASSLDKRMTLIYS